MMGGDDWESVGKTRTRGMNLKQNAGMGNHEAASDIPASNLRRLYIA